MPKTDNLRRLPADLPESADDGAADHLPGTLLPPVSLPSTGGGRVDLSTTLPGTPVAYCYPMAGRPDREFPEGRGVHPRRLGVHAPGVLFSVPPRGAPGARRAGLRREHEGNRVPKGGGRAAAPPLQAPERLPTFEVDGQKLTKRLTMVLQDGRVEIVFYPVFPPNENARRVVEWLSACRAE